MAEAPTDEKVNYYVDKIAAVVKEEIDWIKRYFHKNGKNKDQCQMSDTGPCSLLFYCH